MANMSSFTAGTKAKASEVNDNFKHDLTDGTTAIIFTPTDGTTTVEIIAKGQLNSTNEGEYAGSASIKY